LFLIKLDLKSGNYTFIFLFRGETTLSMFTDEMQMWSKKHIKLSNQIQSVV